jgi:tetratricopeptide (TPR) repeat protein
MVVHRVRLRAVPVRGSFLCVPLLVVAGAASLQAQPSGHVVVSIHEQKDAVQKTMAAHVEGGARPLRVGDTIPPGRALRIEVPGVFVKLRSAVPGSAPNTAREAYVADCAEGSCPLVFAPGPPAGGARTHRGGRVLTQVKELVQRWVAEVWSPGDDRPVNVAVEGTTFAVDTGGADGTFEVVVTDGNVTVTLPGQKPRSIENGRRIVVGRDGVLREVEAERETITRVNQQFTELEVRERERLEAGIGEVGPDGQLRELNIVEQSERVVTQLIASGASADVQAQMLARWNAEGRTVIRTAEDALAAGEAAYDEALRTAQELRRPPDVRTALTLFEIAMAGEKGDSLTRARAQANAGTCLVDLGRFDQAETRLTAALDVLPNEPALLGTLTRLYNDQRWEGSDLVKVHEYAVRRLEASRGQGKQLLAAAFDLLALWRFTDAKRALADAQPLLRISKERRSLGWALMGLGDAAKDTESLASALASYEAALSEFRTLLKSDPGNQYLERDISIVRTRIGDALASLGRGREALAHQQESLAILERLTATDPARASLQRGLAVMLDRVGDRLAELGNRSEALAHHERMLAVVEKLAAAAPGSRDLQRELTVGLHKTGEGLVALGRGEDALARYQRALAIIERLVASEPQNMKLQRDLVVSLEMVGDRLLALGQNEKALTHYERGLTLIGRLSDEAPERTDQQRDLAVLLNKEGDALAALQKHEEALARYESSLAIRNRLVESQSERTDLQQEVCASLDRVARALISAGRGLEAFPHQKRSLEILERLVAKEPGRADLKRELAVSLDAWGRSLVAQGQLTAALAHHERSLTITERLVEKEPGRTDLQRDFSLSLNVTGDVLAFLGRYENALARYERGLPITERLVNAEPGRTELQRDLGGSLSRIGDVLGLLGRYEEALSRYQRSLAIREALLKPGLRLHAKAEIVALVWLIGDLQWRLGRQADARASYERVLATCQELAADAPGDKAIERNVTRALISLSRAVPNGQSPPLLEDALSSLRELDPREPNAEGWCLILLGRYAEARSVLERFLSQLTRDRQEYKYVLGNIGSTYLLQGAVDRAVDWYSKALEFRDFAQILRDDLDEFTRRGLPTSGFDRVRALVNGK